MPREPLVFAFHDDRLYTFEAADQRSGSVFGGPLEATIVGRSFGPKPLHLIAQLSAHHVPVLSEYHLSGLPLIYGMHYDGCQLKYRIEFTHKIELLEIEPVTSSDDWPYPNFPSLLPCIPLRLNDTWDRISYDEFASRFPNMPEKQSAELVVVVPAPATAGVSFWGSADGYVVIVFECDLKAKTVRATNLTD